MCTTNGGFIISSPPPTLNKPSTSNGNLEKLNIQFPKQVLALFLRTRCTRSRPTLLCRYERRCDADSPIFVVSKRCCTFTPIDMPKDQPTSEIPVYIFLDSCLHIHSCLYDRPYRAPRSHARMHKPTCPHSNTRSIPSPCTQDFLNSQCGGSPSCGDWRRNDRPVELVMMGFHCHTPGCLGGLLLNAGS